MRRMLVGLVLVSLVAATSASQASEPPPNIATTVKTPDQINVATLDSMPVMELSLRAVDVPEVTFLKDTAAAGVLFSPIVKSETMAVADTSAEVVHLRYGTFNVQYLKRLDSSANDLMRLRHRPSIRLLTRHNTA